MDYADDIVLISEETDEMQRILDYIVRKEGKLGLIINCAKTEMINMNIANPRTCVIGGRVLKQVEKLKYLGTLLCMNGSLKVEFEER